MPLPMVHLLTAQAVRSFFSPEDLPAYYLGALSPDAVHMRDGYERAQKDASHLRESHHTPMSVRKSNALNLWEKERLGSHRDFYAGYVLHLLTDIAWIDELYFPVYRAAYDQDPYPALDVRTAYYSDCDQLDIRLYDHSPERPEIFYHLMRAKGICVPGLVCEREEALWRDRLLSWFEAQRGTYACPIKYIAYEAITGFIDQSRALLRAFES